MNRIVLPEKVKYIIETITKAGYEAYAVGGCVRDCLLGRRPDDWDITTSASPWQVKALFRRTIDTGIKPGTVTVMLEEEGFEVTTYRIDGEYADSRHPSEVIFTPNLLEDLRRRDFTINAMAYNETGGLVDEFGGMDDIKRQMIRCVGSPKERFGEDALRMMRAVRFSAQLGYRIEEETASSIRRLAPNLKNISAERIQAELTKLVTSGHPEYLETAYETGITKIVMPEFDRCMETPQRNPHHMYSVGVHTLKALQEAAPSRVIRLAVLLHDIGKPACLTTDGDGISHFYGHPEVSEKVAGDILHRLRYDNDTIYMVKKLVKYHDCAIEPTEKGVRRAVMKMGGNVFPLLLEVKRADMLAQSLYRREEKERALETLGRLYETVLEKEQCVSLKTLAINGRDLMAEAGMAPGRELGEVLSKLLDLVVEDPGQNRREILLDRAREMAKNTESTVKGK